MNASNTQDSSLSIYSATHFTFTIIYTFSFAVYLHRLLLRCFYFLLTKDDYVASLPLSLSHTHTYIYFRTTRIFIFNTRRCRQCIFFILAHCCCCSVQTSSARFLPVPFVQEKEVQRVDKLLTRRMHLCMFFFFFL